jgi:FkbM family methyltransferase
MNTNVNYRLLFYVATAATLASAGLTWFTVRRERAREQEIRQYLATPKWVEPSQIDPLRDQGFTYVIDNYGFKYKGVTGTYQDDYVLYYGGWEKDLMFFMEDYLKAVNDPQAVALDVGACTGYHALALARHVKEVHAFEPFPPVLERLKEMLRLNDCKNIIVHEVGLGAEEGKVPFFQPPKLHPGSGSFRSEFEEKPVKFGDLQIVCGDDHLRSHDLASVALIKVDVEGFEKDVLKGLRQTLEKHRPLVIAEVSSPPWGGIASLDELRGLFPENYEFSYFERGREYLFRGEYRTSPFAAYAPRFFAAPNQVDIIAFPREKQPLVPTARAPVQRPS